MFVPSKIFPSMPALLFTWGYIQHNLYDFLNFFCEKSIQFSELMNFKKLYVKHVFPSCLKL